MNECINETMNESIIVNDMKWQKHEKLKEILAGMKSLAVAFSGGVDSTYLLYTAFEVLGDDVAAITIKSPTFPKRENREAAEFTAGLQVRHILVEADEKDLQLYADNPPDRCYICKKAIFKKVMDKAAEYGIYNVADGTNSDDLGDYRPGMKALKELGVRSPLAEAGLTKNEIRGLLKELSIAVWDKPAYACLATRFPCGERITTDKLKMVERAEEFMFGLGFKQVRVRCHGNLARIEVENSERSRFFDIRLLDEIDRKLKELGFRYVSLDLGGYKTGNMNNI